MDSESDFDDGPAATFSARSVDKNLLDTFWDIASPQKEVRIPNSEKLINILIQKQKECEGGEISDDLQYVVERLIKGISSTREGARQGFTITLTLVLKKFKVISLYQVLELVEKYQPISGSKAERGHTVIGRSLVYEAIVRSNRLSDEPKLITTIVISLLGLASLRSYIQVAVINIFDDLLRQITTKKFKEYVKPAIDDKLIIGIINCTPFDLWLFLTCQKLFGEVIDNEFVIEHWGCNPIANIETYSEIGNVLKQTVSVHPIVHPLCHEIIEGVCKLGLVDYFWMKVVEEILLEKNQFERTFLVFEFVKIILTQDFSAINVKTVLSNNLISILMKNIKLKHHPLHPASKQLLSFLIKIIMETKDDSLQITILKTLLLPPGTLLMDSEFKAKHLKYIVSCLSNNNLLEYGSLLENTFRNGGTELSLNSDKILLGTIQCYALKEMTSLLNHERIESDWKVDLLVKFFLWGHFTEKPNKLGLKEVIPDLSLLVVQASRQSFLRGVELYLRPTQKQGYHGRLNQTCKNLIPLFQKINEIIESNNNFEPQLEKTLIMEQWGSMYSMVTKLLKHSQKEPKDEDFKIFITLFIQVGFDLFSPKEANRAGEVIGELCECAKRALKEKKRSGKNDTIKEDGPPWIGVLVDLFLSLLSEGSAHIRDVVGSVFPLLGSRIDEMVLQQILDVILPEKEKLLIGEDEEMNESSDEEVEFDLASCSDDESSVNSSVTTEPDKEFVNKVAKALGPAADNENDSNEEYLSDSEMFKLDDAIAAAFRGRIKSKKMDETEQFLMNFRLRCLDLINKYLKSEPPLRQVLQCIPPLLAGLKFAIGNKNQILFYEKIVTALETLTKIHKFRNVDKVKQADLEKLFNQLIENLGRSTDQRLSKEISSICVYLVVCTKKVVNDDDDVEVWYAGAFEKLVKEYFENIKCHISPTFFTQLFQQCPEAASEVLELIAKYAFSDNVRLFKRTKALEFLHAAASSVTNAKLAISKNKKYWLAFWSNLMPKFASALLQMYQIVKVHYVFELLSVGILLLVIKKNLSLATDVSPEFVDAIKNFPSTKCDKGCKKRLLKLKKLVGLPPSEVVVSQKKQKRKKNDSISIETIIPNKIVKLDNESATPLNGNSKVKTELEPKPDVDANITISPSKKKKNKKKKNKGNLLLINGDHSSENLIETNLDVSKKKNKNQNKVNLLLVNGDNSSENVIEVNTDSFKMKRKKKNKNKFKKNKSQE